MIIKTTKIVFYRVRKQTTTQTDHILSIDQKTKKATQMSGFFCFILKLFFDKLLRFYYLVIRTKFHEIHSRR